MTFAGWLWRSPLAAHLLVVACALTPSQRTPARCGVAGGGHPVGAGDLRHGRLPAAVVSIGRTSHANAWRRTEHLPAPKLSMPRPSMSRRASTPLFDLCRSINGFGPVGGKPRRPARLSGAPIDEPKLGSPRRRLDTPHRRHRTGLRERSTSPSTSAMDDGAGGSRSPMPSRRCGWRRQQCRQVMVDDLAPRAPSPGARALEAISATPASWLLENASTTSAQALAPLRVQPRVDLRDHRKIVVIDNRIAYCGSQNCADLGNRRPSSRRGIDIPLRCVKGRSCASSRYLFLERVDR